MNPAQPSLCFIIPYFGSWPHWMPFFLASCRANSDIDWLLFTDCGPLADCPPNVRTVDTSFADYCERISARLGIPFSPDNPYKLCDLKPALGYIHEKELTGYDFWAFGDLDLVYGNLRAYFTAERLACKDLFSTHQRRISGHLCLLRNTQEIRELFFKIKNWRHRFSQPVPEALDEGAFSRIFINRKNWPAPLARLWWQLNPWYRRAEFIEAFSTPNAKVPWLDGNNRFPERWFWEQGNISNDLADDRVFPYFHFMVWKRLEKWKYLPATQLSAYARLAETSSWQISENGFEPIAGDRR